MRLVVSESSAYAVDDVPGLFVVENEPLERLLFDRNRIGLDFSLTCLDAVRLMLSHVSEELSDVEAELILLSKGLVYQLSRAVPEVTGAALPTNLLATRRAQVLPAGVLIEVPYCRLDSPASRLIIGDTAASGATVVQALDLYVRHCRLEAVLIVSMAGALSGAHYIRQFCESREIGLTMVFGLAAFGLGDNGFDLSFLHPETITRSEYRVRASQQFDGRPVSAVGWDFGSQVIAPNKYRNLCWVEAKYWGLLGHPAFAVAEQPHDMSTLGAEAGAFRAGAYV